MPESTSVDKTQLDDTVRLRVLEDSYVRKDQIWDTIQGRLDDRYVKKDDLFRQWWMVTSWGVLMILAIANLIAQFA